MSSILFVFFQLFFKDYKYAMPGFSYIYIYRYNYISVTWWQSVLLAEKTVVPGENHY
jgi:hypothetical protein